MTSKAKKVKAEKPSKLEGEYDAIFQIVNSGFRPQPLPENMSLAQPSPYQSVPSIATNGVMEASEETPNA